VNGLGANCVGANGCAGATVCNPDGGTGSACPGSKRNNCNVCGAPASNLCWVDDGVLLAHEVAPWMEMPLWIPESEDEMGGLGVARGGMESSAAGGAHPVSTRMTPTSDPRITPPRRLTMRLRRLRSRRCRSSSW